MTSLNIRNELKLRYTNLVMISGSEYIGEILNQDEVGIIFIPDDKELKSCFVPWHNIRRIDLL